jgi:ribosomal protein S18 acetylase RimI-like enzyme
MRRISAPRKFTIRRAREPDLSSIAELKGKLDKHHQLPGLWPPEGERRQHVVRYRKMLHQHLARLFVAEQSSRKIVGYLTAFIQTRKCNQKGFKRVGVIGEAMVEELHRKRGIGTALVDAATRFFSTKGIRHVTVRNAVRNTLANKFWDCFTFNPVLYTRTTTITNLEKTLRMRNKRTRKTQLKAR